MKTDQVVCPRCQRRLMVTREGTLPHHKVPPPAAAYNNYSGWGTTRLPSANEPWCRGMDGILTRRGI